MTDTITCPEILYDPDGSPIALRRDLAKNPAQAIRYVLCEGEHEWLLDGLPGRWIEPDEEDFRYSQAALMELCRATVPRYMRPWHEATDDLDSEFGKDAWFWSDPMHPQKVEVWELPWS